MANTLHQIIRDERAKSRFAFILLDIFLAGVIVSIALLITLKIPVGIAEKTGGGGEPFMFIEVWWDNDLMFVTPQLDHLDISTFPGIAAEFTPPGSAQVLGAWPIQDSRTGKLIDNYHAGYFERIVTDGFNPGRAFQMKTEVDGKIWNYGYAWVSSPCPGEWKLKIRASTATSILKDRKVTVWTQVRWDGYSGDQDTKMQESKRVAEQELFKQKGHRDYLIIDDESVSIERIIVLPDSKEPISGCPEA